MSESDGESPIVRIVPSVLGDNAGGVTRPPSPSCLLIHRRRRARVSVLLSRGEVSGEEDGEGIFCFMSDMFRFT